MRLSTTSATVLALSTLALSSAAQGEAPGTPPPQGQPPPSQPSEGQPPSPSAGGLTAPPPVDASQQDERNQTEKDLDESKNEDSGRGLSWFYLDAEGGFEHVGLETFSVDQTNLTAGMVPSTASGGFLGAGLGVQLLFLTIGPRFRVGFFPDWEMFSIGGELGFRIPVGMLEPHFELGGGYEALGSLGGALSSNADAISIRGAFGRISGGLDIFIGKVFSLGPEASWEFMALTRPSLNPTDIQGSANCQTATAQQAKECALQADGSSWGSAVSIGGKLGLHF